MSLLAIIPCFNEGLSIQETIRSILVVDPTASILVVDNASTDDTSAKARELGASVLFEPRAGKGIAFRRGLVFLSPEISAVLMVDGDATYGMESLAEAVQMVAREGFDMARKSFKELPAFELECMASAARASEGLEELEDAKKRYEEVVSRFGESTIGREIRQRMKEMDEKDRWKTVTRIEDSLRKAGP
jgi:glycosyltransferase involved in cell wall biosynthesis